MAKGTDYSTYLRINDLLRLQVPLTEDAPDELLFIVVHQAYELWFKVMIDELTRAAHGSARQRAVASNCALAPHRRDRKVAARTPTPARHDVPRGVSRVPRPARPGLGIPVLPVPGDRILERGGRNGRRSTSTSSTTNSAPWLREVSEQPNVWAGFEHSLRVLTTGASAQDASRPRAPRSTASTPTPHSRRCTRWPSS